ncbi:MAG: 3TM-type holin [Candidatus Methanoperedens sp.]|nr:3TM-type holin [Candidatus Methanoperedens sp.]
MGISLANIDIGGVLGGVGNLAKSVREAITGKSIIDPNKQAELLQQAQQIEFDLVKAQTDINLAEAKSTSVFVAGWRPFIGWVCGSALAWNYIFQPLLFWFLNIINHPVNPPALDIGELITLLFALLGLGGMRTFEKAKNVEGNR